MAAEGNRSGQALTGVGVGQVLSFEKCHLSGADGMPILGKQYPPWRQWQVMLEPGEVKDPDHAPLYNTHGRSQTTSNGVVAVRAVEEGEEPNDPYERCWEVGQTHTSEEADEQR